MTISSDLRRAGPFNGNGSTTVFAREFVVLNADHLKVFQTISGVTTEVTSGISKDGIGTAAGNVTFSTAPSVGTQITLLRAIPLVQETDYSNQGKVQPERVEDDFDLQEMKTQDLSETVGRALRLPITSNITDPVVPEPVAGKTIIGKTDGSGWEDGPTADQISSANAASISAAADAEQTALDRIAVAADRVATNQDTIDTAADVVSTGDDAIATAADRVATNQDAIDTAADLAATNQDAIDTAADAVTTGNDASTATDAKIAAQAARDSALAAFDNFDDKYLGPKASDPTVDNDGDPLAAGMLYFNTSDGAMKIYTGSTWGAAYIAAEGVLLVASNLSDLDSAPTALTNLGVSAFVRTVLGNATAAVVRTTLGLGAAALKGISTATDWTVDPTLLSDRARTKLFVDAEIPIVLNAAGSAPLFACRAWVHFNGNSTLSITGSGNVSSITDNGTGDYTINFSTSMEDATYAVVASSSGNNDQAYSFFEDSSFTRTTAAVRMINTRVSDVSRQKADSSNLSLAIFR